MKRAEAAVFSRLEEFLISEYNDAIHEEVGTGVLLLRARLHFQTESYLSTQRVKSMIEKAKKSRRTKTHYINNKLYEISWDQEKSVTIKTK